MIRARDKREGTGRGLPLLGICDRCHEADAFHRGGGQVLCGECLTEDVPMEIPERRATWVPPGTLCAPDKRVTLEDIENNFANDPNWWRGDMSDRMFRLLLAYRIKEKGIFNDDWKDQNFTAVTDD